MITAKGQKIGKVIHLRGVGVLEDGFKVRELESGVRALPSLSFSIVDLPPFCEPRV